VPVNFGFAAAPFYVYGRGMCTIYLLEEYAGAVNPDPDHTFVWLPGLCE
jgi:hypothetical protein